MINPRLIAHLSGWIVLFTGLAFLFPLIPAYVYGDGSAKWFWQSLAVSTFTGGFLLAVGGNTSGHEPRYRESVAVVGISWFLISLAGSLPFVFSGLMDPWSALFESFSGFSSTGSTAIADLRIIPKGLLFWRSVIQWFGGMGIIVLMVAVLPFLGVGGQIMLKSELSGPTSDKLRPRVAQVAKILWGMYVSLTVLLIVLLRLGGLDFFESVCQALVTISTGGFSNYNESAAYHDSRYVQSVILAFMFFGAINFALYWQALTGNWRALILNAEVLFLVGILLLCSGVAAANLVWTGTIPAPGEAFFQALFQTTAVSSTTGQFSADWTSWPYLAQAMVFFLFFVGGCSGSTSGGVKCVRWLLLFKSIRRACRRMIHPRGVFPVRIQGKNISEHTLESVWLFFLVYFLTMAVSTLAITATGLDIMTAFSSSASALANVGPSLGLVGATGSYAAFPPVAKVILSLCMLLGRLEFYSFIVIFFPEFWRR
ncbi:MAG: TrkH family potassium uptake protein [Deltaproteobacteria bacterium]|jgi:trk system potassium uptake protein TrkH|nr:TrkH family potassium uptake protein [Deltaproteobacteria bacterium]